VNLSIFCQSTLVFGWTVWAETKHSCVWKC